MKTEARVRAIRARSTKRDYPRIIVPPPGPRARALIARDLEWASPSYSKEYPLVVARGEGVMLEDVDGNRYLDFMAGIAVASTGHAHPAVVAAIQQAASQFLHVSSPSTDRSTAAPMVR
jgi:4-aminobutyrate aminotransferase